MDSLSTSDYLQVNGGQECQRSEYTAYVPLTTLPLAALSSYGQSHREDQIYTVNNQDWPQILQDMLPRARTLGPEMEQYFHYHYQRFIQLGQFVRPCVELLHKAESQITLLDIGPSFQTAMLARAWPQMKIDTLGFADSKFPPPQGGHHIDFNLNATWDSSQWPAAHRTYDILVMAEVIEHLHTSPIWVLKYLAGLMNAGAFLVVTTPNAVALPKRLRVLLGGNPNELIREEVSNPGHFREYTLAELIQLGHAAGLIVHQSWSGMATSTGSWANCLYRRISTILPASLQKELMVIYQKVR